MATTVSGSESWSFGSKKDILRTARDRVVRSGGNTDNLKRREESVFVQRARQEAAALRRRKEQRFFTFLISIVIALLIVGVHLTYKAMTAPLPEPRLNGMGMGYTRVEVASFQLAGVAPGMTPAMVRKVHPAARTRVTEGGVTVSSLSFRGADVTVWHLSQPDGQQAFRIRTVQTFDASREADVMASLGQRYGRPLSDDCDVSAVTGAKDCRYSWRAQAIDLKAHVRQTAKGALELTLTAEDVQIHAFLKKHTG